MNVEELSNGTQNIFLVKWLVPMKKETCYQSWRFRHSLNSRQHSASEQHKSKTVGNIEMVTDENNMEWIGPEKKCIACKLQCCQFKFDAIKAHSAQCDIIPYFLFCCTVIVIFILVLLRSFNALWSFCVRIYFYFDLRFFY